MLGTAGIGYFLLRLYDAEQFPAVLLPAGQPPTRGRARQ
jgi:hypothetical protein